MINRMLGAMHHPMIVADSADFDGANDYMTRGAGLTGASDSKIGIVSCWVKIDSASGIDSVIQSTVGVGGRFSVFAQDGLIRISGDNSADSGVLFLETASTFIYPLDWTHILASWDLATGAGHLYIDDVSDLNTGTDVLTDDTVDHTTDDWVVGALTASGTDKFNGEIADLYFAPGQYLDFSLVANRRKFISASGKPVHLGTTGALPTGTAPLVYFHLDDAEAVANFATNRGTGGDFTITGTLATGSTSPSD